MNIFLDIETLPTCDPLAIAQIAAKIKPPGTIKKAESIAAWMAENKEDAIKDALSKTSFDGLYGSIACICYAFDDGDVFSENCLDGEKIMLENFYSHVYDMTTERHNRGVAELPVVVIGHNVAAFDLPFLKHRSIINRVKPPAQLLKAMNAKPWDGCIADTMLMWSQDREKRASMDKLCHAFGIDGKGDFDGSMVAETWPIDPQKVIDYCREDVLRTRHIYNRLMFK